MARNGGNASPVILGVLASCAMVVIAALLLGVGLYLMVLETPQPPRTDKVASGWKYLPLTLAAAAALGSVPIGVLVARSARRVFDHDSTV